MEKAIILCFLIWDCFSPLVSSLNILGSGEKLSSFTQLVSEKKTFTLGFYTPENTNNSYLGIWYTNGDAYPVWFANRNRPIYKDSGVLTISNAGEVIIEHNGGEPVKIFKPENGKNVTATLLDSGNFVVEEVNLNGSSVLWQSFDYPTDTLLLGMKLGFNHVTGRSWALTSWFSATNPASGPFTLEWDIVRRRLIVRRRGVIYWTSGDLKFDYEDRKVKFYSFDYIVPKPDSLNLNYVFKNVTNQDEEYFTYSLFVDRFTPEHRKIVSSWRLDYQGNIFDPNRLAIALVEGCYGYNTRGVGNEVYLGCEFWEQPKCRNNHQKFSYMYGYFEFNTSELLYEEDSNLSQSDCRAKCWNDCECVAFDGGEDGCSYWRGENAKLLQDDAGMSQKLYFLVSEPSKERERSVTGGRLRIIIPVAIASVLLTAGTALFIFRKFKQGKTKRKKQMRELMVLEGYTETAGFENDGGHDLKMFSYVNILASTNNFSSNNKLGEGGFGPVYKGKMPEGREIAIKLLSRGSKQGLVEFKTELILISKLQHRNLVKVLGFCIHGNEKMIVYVYVPNKSLDFFLFDPAKKEELNWGTRLNIIEGIAQGLLYLHKHSRLLIIHRDLKSSNILLDEKMNPIISDFDLARILNQNVMEANTSKRVGTYGYMAPEYVTEGIFSIKSDIYSFGVLILEIVCGLRNNSFQNVEGPLTVVHHAWELWKQCAELELVDSMLNCADNNKDQLRRCIQIGLLCVQNHAIDRPSTEDVMSMLINEASLPLPKEPAFVVRNNVTQNLPKSNSQKSSRNELSVSAMDGR